MSARAERAVFAFVLLVWLAFTVRACVWLARVASPIAMSDDLVFVLPLHPGYTEIWADIWMPINEHRVPLARAIMLAFMQLTGDVRTGMFAQVALLSACALVLVLLARRLRGRASVFDVAFPLLFLHLGYTESWLLAMQLTVALPVFLVVALLVLALRDPGPPSARKLAAAGTCVLALTTCGGFGWCQIAPWAAWIGWCALRARRPGELRAAWTGAAFTLAIAFASVLYAIGLPYRAQRVGVAVDKAIAIAAQFTSSFAGPAAGQQPVLFVSVAIALAVGTTWGLVRVLRARPDERERAGALLACTLGVLGIACAVGVSRQDAWPVAGWAARYMGAPAPLAVCAALAAVAWAPRGLALATQAVLVLALLLALPANESVGRGAGEDREQLTREFYAEVAHGAELSELGERFWKRCFLSAASYTNMLRIQLDLGQPPFDRERTDDPARYDKNPLAALPVPPRRWSAARELIHRRVDGVHVVGMQSDAELVYAAGSVRRVIAKFGTLPWMSSANTLPEQRTLGVVFSVVLVAPGGAERVLWERRLDPANVVGDRGLHALELTLPADVPPAGEQDELVFRVRGVKRPPSTSDWGLWGAIELR